MITPLPHRDFDDGPAAALLEQLHFRGHRPAVQINAAGQFCQGLVIHLPFRGHPVGPGYLVAGMGQALGQLPVVREEHEAGGVIVQPSHRVEAAVVLRGEIHDRAPALGVPGGGHTAVRLVQHEGHRGRRQAHLFAFHLHPVPVRVDLHPHLGHHPAIDGNLAVQDQVFTRPPGNYPGPGEKFL